LDYSPQPAKQFAASCGLELCNRNVFDEKIKRRQEAKTNELIKQLKEMIQEEREIENNQDVEMAVIQRKGEWMQSHQQEIIDACRKGFEDGLSRGYGLAAIYILVPSNSDNVILV
jgi:hypothetical protein